MNTDLEKEKELFYTLIDSDYIYLTYDLDIFNKIFGDIIVDKLKYNEEIGAFIEQNTYKNIFKKIKNTTLNEYQELIKFHLKYLENIKTKYKDLFNESFIKKLTLTEYKILFLSLIFVHFNIKDKDFNEECEIIFDNNEEYAIIIDNKTPVDYFAYFEFKDFVNNKIKII